VQMLHEVVEVKVDFDCDSYMKKKGCPATAKCEQSGKGYRVSGCVSGDMCPKAGPESAVPEHSCHVISHTTKCC